MLTRHKRVYLGQSTRPFPRVAVGKGSGYVRLPLAVLLVKNLGFLPARASEQGNVIGSVRIMCVQKKIVIERTRDQIYLKFLATDFFPKITSPSAGENSGDLA